MTERSTGRSVARTTLRCPTCAGSELYVLTRSIGADLIELYLCRACDADNPLVRAIDELTEDAFRE